MSAGFGVAGVLIGSLFGAICKCWVLLGEECPDVTTVSADASVLSELLQIQVQNVHLLRTASGSSVYGYRMPTLCAKSSPPCLDPFSSWI